MEWVGKKFVFGNLCFFCRKLKALGLQICLDRFVTILFLEIVREKFVLPFLFFYKICVFFMLVWMEGLVFGGAGSWKFLQNRFQLIIVFFS